MSDYNKLTPDEENAIFKATIWDNPYIPKNHIPFPKQIAALLDFRKELLYGGAAGGGKSDYLLMAGLQFVGVPGYNGIIFRRSYTDLSLPDGLIPRSHEWLVGTDAKYHGDLHQWTFPQGSSLTFGYLESENDIYRYKSAQFQFVGYEELTEFPTERFYTYLFSRMRKLRTANVPVRMRCTTNPDGPGADWVYERFKPDGPQPTSIDRNFIQSKLDDNPHIDQEGYEANLDELDPVTREQLRNGAWRVKKSGNKFKQEWFDRAMCNLEEVPQDGIVVRYWDLAATEEKKRGSKTTDPDYTVGARVRLYQNKYYIEDIRRGRFAPGALEDFIRDTAELDGPDVMIFIEQEPGATGKMVIDDFIRRVLSGYAVFGDRPSGNKEMRANIFSAALFNRNVYVIRADWTKSLVNESCLFPSKGIHDDQVDAVSGAIGRLPRAKRWKSGEIGAVETSCAAEGYSEFNNGPVVLIDDLF
jgi:predicted phage terminase large subunit-like protein